MVHIKFPLLRAPFLNCRLNRQSIAVTVPLVKNVDPLSLSATPLSTSKDEAVKCFQEITKLQARKHASLYTPADDPDAFACLLKNVCELVRIKAEKIKIFMPPEQTLTLSSRADLKLFRAAVAAIPSIEIIHCDQNTSVKTTLSQNNTVNLCFVADCPGESPIFNSILSELPDNFFDYYLEYDHHASNNGSEARVEAIPAKRKFFINQQGAAACILEVNKFYDQVYQGRSLENRRLIAFGLRNQLLHMSTLAILTDFYNTVLRAWSPTREHTSEQLDYIINEILCNNLLESIRFPGYSVYKAASLKRSPELLNTVLQGLKEKAERIIRQRDEITKQEILSQLNTPKFYQDKCKVVESAFDLASNEVAESIQDYLQSVSVLAKKYPNKFFYLPKIPFEYYQELNRTGALSTNGTESFSPSEWDIISNHDLNANTQVLKEPLVEKTNTNTTSSKVVFLHSGNSLIVRIAKTLKLPAKSLQITVADLLLTEEQKKALYYL